MMNDYKNVSGRIFDIQRYSIHDGVGIRTIVFLKGCALRCKWCCNPESQEYAIQTMMVNGKPKTIGRDVSVAEVMEVVRRDMPYYGRSGGGLTLSGGESLLQPEFAAALREAADAGVRVTGGEEHRHQYGHRKHGICRIFRDSETFALAGHISDGYQAYECGKTQRIYRKRKHKDA